MKLYEVGHIKRDINISEKSVVIFNIEANGTDTAMQVFRKYQFLNISLLLV